MDKCLLICLLTITCPFINALIARLLAEFRRMKKVVRDFMTVPFKWVVKGCHMWLRLYTDKPYDCPRL